MENYSRHLKTGSTITEFSFDAWGRRRDKDDWSYILSGEPVLFADRGFTGHEWLPWFYLYNMNGRLYDPAVGRFLSVDPYIQNPLSTQEYHRYSYCLDNPLKYTTKQELQTQNSLPLVANGAGGSEQFYNLVELNLRKEP